jgi:iron complex outermembrane recepter protein
MSQFARRFTLLAGISLLASPAMAQEAADENEDIVVIIPQAYQGDFDPREVPQSVAVLGEELLQQNATLRLTDALDLNASVSRQNNFGGLWDSFAVRGFAGDENLPSGYLVNGFNAGRGFGGSRDVAGVERIEILRGPSAALFGRGEPGGTVNIVTKQAIFGEMTGSFSVLAGSYDRYRGDADVNVALGDNVAVRLIGFYEDADSFRDTVNSNRYGLLPQIAVRFGERTTLTYDLE